MSPEQVKLIAEELLRQSFIENWIWYALLVAVSGLIGAVSSFGTAYLVRRGELAATKTAFIDLQNQLAASTRLSEGIKTELKSLSERVLRIEDLKRQKLERYLLLVYGVQDYETQLMFSQFYAKQAPDGPSPMYEVNVIQSLYLPELDGPHKQFSDAIVAFRNWVSEGMKIQLEIKRSTGAASAPGPEHMSQFEQLSNASNNALSVVRGEAKKLAARLLATDEKS